MTPRSPADTGIVSRFSSGGGGIRTHEALARLTVFKTVPFDRSGTPPEPHCDGYRLIFGRAAVLAQHVVAVE